MVAHAERVGTRALGRLREIQRRHALIGDLRGRGLLLGIGLVEDRDSKRPARAAAERVLARSRAGCRSRRRWAPS
jgi:4-aminobutyrate aminotransferase